MGSGAHNACLADGRVNSAEVREYAVRKKRECEAARRTLRLQTTRSHATAAVTTREDRRVQAQEDALVRSLSGPLEW